MRLKTLGMALALLTCLPGLVAATDDCSKASEGKAPDGGKNAHVFISVHNKTSGLLVSTLSRDTYSYKTKAWTGKEQINTINTAAGETDRAKSRFAWEDRTEVAYYVDIPGFGESLISFTAREAASKFNSATLADGITCDRRWSYGDLAWYINLKTASAPTQ